MGPGGNGNGVWGTGGMGYKWYVVQGVWGTGGMGYRGYGVQGVWATWAMGHMGVMGHMGNGAHGQWGTWAMGPKGDWHIIASKSIITGWILTKILLDIDIDVFYLNTGRFFHDGLN